MVLGYTDKTCNLIVDYAITPGFAESILRGYEFLGAALYLGENERIGPRHIRPKSSKLLWIAPPPRHIREHLSSLCIRPDQILSRALDKAPRKASCARASSASRKRNLQFCESYSPNDNKISCAGRARASLRVEGS